MAPGVRQSDNRVDPYPTMKTVTLSDPDQCAVYFDDRGGNLGERTTRWLLPVNVGMETLR